MGMEHGDQTLLLHAFGYASRTWSIPATLETRFDTALITKLLTAVRVGDLLRFHRAVIEGRLLDPALTREPLSPQARHGARRTGSHLMGFGFEFETAANGSVRSYWKEWVNMGASGMLRHYRTEEITVAVLAVGEKAASAPRDAIDDALEVGA